MRDLFKSALTSLQGAYKECVQALGEKLSNDKASILARQISEKEGQLAVLFYIIGSIIGGHIPSMANQDEHQSIDAELCSMLLMILPIVDHRLASPNPIPKTKYLDLAILYFLGEFRKNHIGQRSTRFRFPPLPLSLFPCMPPFVRCVLLALFCDPVVVGKRAYSEWLQSLRYGLNLPV